MCFLSHPWLPSTFASLVLIRIYFRSVSEPFPYILPTLDYFLERLHVIALVVSSLILFQHKVKKNPLISSKLITQAIVMSRPAKRLIYLIFTFFGGTLLYLF